VGAIELVEGRRGTGGGRVSSKVLGRRAHSLKTCHRFCILTAGKVKSSCTSASYDTCSSTDPSAAPYSHFHPQW
jgi:hypothetical protein